MYPPTKVSAILAGVATLEVALGLAGAVRGFVSGSRALSVAGITGIALVLSFTVTAGLLLYGRRRDPRAMYLGVSFLMVATSFSANYAGGLRGVGGLASGLDALAGIQPDAFLPFYLWCFFSTFPRIRTIGPDRWSWWGRTVALLLGILLFAYTGLRGLTEAASRPSWVRLLDRENPVGLYWLLLFGATLPALLYALHRVRRADPEERRRTNLLFFGCALGSLPITLLVLGTIFSSSFHEFVTRRPWFGLSQAIAYPALLCIPTTTVYAVLARGALDVRLVVRAAIRYLLARQTVLALFLLPAVVALAVLISGRDQPLASLLSGSRGWILFVTAAVGLLGLRFRQGALSAVDRRFFREQYDARSILRALVHGVRDVRNVDELAALLAREVHRALHPRFVFVLTLDPATGQLESPAREVPPLPEDSGIAATLLRVGSPVEPDRISRSSPASLPGPELYWLGDLDAELIVPLIGRGERLLGVILLGGKRSELPFSREDRGLLTDIAAAGTETLEQRLISTLERGLEGTGTAPGSQVPHAPEPSDLDRAWECEECGRLASEHLDECPTCGGEMEDAPVPLLLRGTYRMEARVGRGGMGIVYRALDLTLRRPVAVKTLLRADPDSAARLRHEARAMASVAHPNLATVFGAETWKGLPLILEEFFTAGTLEHRLARGRLSVSQTLELGIHLAAGVMHLHDLGMLHRDIKPSNIGFAGDGQPKLLDFGLVQFASADDAPRPFPPVSALPAPKGNAAQRLDDTLLPEPTGTGRVRGTVPYLSPEVLLGGRPSAASDLWSLSVVLFESIAGANPFLRPGGAARLTAPDLRTYTPGCPWSVADLFSRLLSPDRSQRPGTVGDLRNELAALAGEIGTEVVRGDL